jgi:hypothetical protein
VLPYITSSEALAPIELVDSLLAMLQDALTEP